MTHRRYAALLPLCAPALARAADAPVSAAGSLLQVFVGLVAVLLLIAATAWVAKRFGVARPGASNLLQIVSSASLGARERVVVVEIGESWLVVGVAPGSVNALATLPKGTLPPSTGAGIGLGLRSPFAARLQRLIERSPYGDEPPSGNKTRSGDEPPSGNMTRSGDKPHEK
ncbi:MAG: flagellar biosynthetic protein FliO [Thiobacillus sp.]